MAPRVLTDEQMAALEHQESQKPRVLTDEDMRALENQQAAGEHGHSSYEGAADDDLNILQRLEKKAVDWGLVKPGMEMFSPKSIDAKKQVLQTAANDVTGGYVPQIAGALKTGSVSSPDYIAARDAKAQELDSVPTPNKVIGHTLGALPLVALPAAGSAIGSTAGRIGAAAATGAAYGGLANPGDAPGELDPVQGGARLRNAGVGAAIAAAPEALAAGVGAAAQSRPGQYLANKFQDMAEKRAVKQGGAMLGDFRSLENRGRLNETGQAMLEHKIVTPLASLQDVADRSGALAEQHGQKIGQVVEALDSRFPQLAESQVAGNLFNPARAADRIEQELLNPLRHDSALGDLVPPLQKKVDALRAMGDRPMPFGKAREIVGNYDKLIKDWGTQGPPGKELIKQMRGVISDEIDRGIESVGKATNFPLLEQWRQSKQMYGTMKGVNEMASDQLLRHEAKHLISNTDYGMGGAAAVGAKMVAASNPAAAAAFVGGAAAHHVANKYGSALAATGLNAAAKGLRALPEASAALERGFQGTGQAVQALQHRGGAMPGATTMAENSQPAGQDTQGRVLAKVQGTKWEQPLQQAAQRGDDAWAANYFMLSSRDPEFRAHMESDDDQ